MAASVHVAWCEFRDEWHASSRLEVTAAAFASFFLLTAPAAMQLVFPVWMNTFPGQYGDVLGALSAASVVACIFIFVVCGIIFAVHRRPRFPLALSCLSGTLVLLYGVLRAGRDVLLFVATPKVPSAIAPMVGIVSVAIVVGSRILIHPERQCVVDIGSVAGCLFVIAAGVVRVSFAGWGAFDFAAGGTWLLIGATVCEGLFLVVASAYIHRLSLPRAAFALGGYQHRLHAQSPSSTLSGKSDFPLVLAVVLGLGSMVYCVAIVPLVSLHGLLDSAHPMDPVAAYRRFSDAWTCAALAGSCQLENLYWMAAFALSVAATLVCVTFVARFSPVVAMAAVQFSWPLSALIRCLGAGKPGAPAEWSADAADNLGAVSGNLVLSLVAIVAFTVSEFYLRGSAGVLQRQLDENASERSPLHRRHHQYDHYL